MLTTLTTLRRITIAGLLLAFACAAQSPSVLTVGQAQAPSPISVTQAGTAGTTTYYYWIVAIYAGGRSLPAGPLSTFTSNATLSATNYNIVTFGAPTSPIAAVTGYDILRTTTATPPTATCACAVATNQSSSPVNDQSNTLNAYSNSFLGSVAVTVVGDNVTTASTTQGAIYVAGTRALNISSAGGIMPVTPTQPFTTFQTPPAPPPTTLLTSTTDANGTIWWTPVAIPYTSTLTGACVMLGAGSLTDSVILALYNQAGAVVAQTAGAGTALSGSAGNMQCIAFTGTVTVTGPNIYALAVQGNGTTAGQFYTYAAGSIPKVGCNNQTGVFNTLANITWTSTFNAGKCPVMTTY